MAIILYPNPNTRRTVEHAIASGKLILWIYDKVRTLFHNPGITSGATAGAICSPSDGGTAFGADYIIRGGTDGFASAARAAGLYVGSGLSSEFADDLAAQSVWSNLTFVRRGVVSGA